MLLLIFYSHTIHHVWLSTRSSRLVFCACLTMRRTYGRYAMYHSRLIENPRLNVEHKSPLFLIPKQDNHDLQRHIF